ncbi:MAG: TrkH family potassium uptake protein, partial [Spirochaetes bacterium]|nr:TrkH family potassium uptake protein [Spirochaetota bacterium]
MKWKIVFKIQGYLLIILAAAMSISAIYSMANGLNDFKAILYGSIITCSIGLLLVFLLRTDQEVRAREGFVVVTLGWIFAALFGALPFYLHGSFGSYINCVFETMSGFTTTGATILTNIEIIPKGLLLWRSMTHWLGGMGIILLTIAILPILGISYGKLFNAEVPGPTKDRLSPKIKSTAKILWLIYLGMTFLETVLLMFGGMDLYNALCHTFGTLATGGFSTQNASVGMYNSVFIETVIIFFMYLAGINFALHFHLIKGNLKKFFANREWQVFTVVLLTAVGFIALNLYLSPNQVLAKYKDFPEALRASFFQVFSITTTTGFTTENFNLWPAFSKFLLVILMFLGGCAGSTGGGLKQIRIIIIIKA